MFSNVWFHNSEYQSFICDRLWWIGFACTQNIAHMKLQPNCKKRANFQCLCGTIDFQLLCGCWQLAEKKLGEQSFSHKLEFGFNMRPAY